MTTQTTIRKHILLCVCAVLTVMCVLQQPGKIVADTKLDVAINPLKFLSTALSLWNPQQNFGGIPYQAYGFLFPMGPFFAAGHAFHLPTWLLQRLWLSALLSIAFWGIIRLSEVLEIGSKWSRLIAAGFYVMAPPLSVMGYSTNFILPLAFLPWVMIPLVKGSRIGSTRSAAARSGLALLFMGGINAAAVIAILPVPIIWILTRAPSRRRNSLGIWWLISVGLACFWWSVALLFEGKYGFNLLPFTERAWSTTSTTAMFDLLRGNTNWLAYSSNLGLLDLGGYVATASRVVILCGAVLVGMALFGLAHREMKHKTWILATLLLGTVILGSAYGGSFGAAFPRTFQRILDGPLAPFRNIWKFQGIIAILMALGIAHCLHLLLRTTTLTTVVTKYQAYFRIGCRALLILFCLVLLFGVGKPFVKQQFYSPGSFSEVPNYWSQTADWLGSHAGYTTSYVVPGTPGSIYLWGAPLDDPMQWLAKSNWAIRGQMPNSSQGNIELQNAIGQILTSKESTEALPGLLERSGVKYLVVRNDIPLSADHPSPQTIQAELSSIVGLRRVAGFGPSTYGLQAVDIYAVDGSVTPIEAISSSHTTLVSGGAGSIVDLLNLGLQSNDPVIFAGQNIESSNLGQTVASDSNRRASVFFGDPTGTPSYTLSPSEEVPGSVSPLIHWAVVPGSKHETTVHYFGIQSIAASSFSSFALVPQASEKPAAAFDGNLDTAWVADSADNSLGQWIQINFGREIPLNSAQLSIVMKPSTPQVHQIEVSTERGSRKVDLKQITTGQVFKTPKGRSKWLRITFSKVSSALRPNTIRNQGAGIREIKIPGVNFQNAIQLPNDLPLVNSPGLRRDPIYLFHSESNRPLTFFGGIDYSAQGIDPEAQMKRLFNVPYSSAFGVKGTVQPRAGVPLSNYISSLGKSAPDSATFTLPCGSGPTFSIDKNSYRTSVSGTIGNLRNWEPIPFTVCTTMESINLYKGTHFFSDKSSGPLKIASVVMIPNNERLGSFPTSYSRDIKIINWGSNKRQVKVGSGTASYLVMHQNFNEGWQAKFNGVPLESLEVDGWQQAWRLPAGRAGTVDLIFAPNSGYQIGLIIGALLALILVLLAFSRERKPGRGTFHERIFNVYWLSGIASLGFFLIGGFLAALLPIVLVVSCHTRMRRFLPWVALTSMVLAGIWVVAFPGAWPASGHGVFNRWTQLLAICALIATTSGLILSHDKKSS